MTNKIDSIILSIVTVCYNCENELRITMESVKDQIGNIDCSFIEYIIVDGASKDNTYIIANEYLDVFRVHGMIVSSISEPDRGIYDAMNKGVQKCHGNWTMLLNAGDTFHEDDSLKKLFVKLKQCDADVVYSDYCRINRYVKKIVPILDINGIYKTMIFCHQAVFIRSKLYEKFKFNINYKLVADYDFVLNLYLLNYKFEHFEEVLINYDIDGVSGTKMVATYKEIYTVRKRHGCIKNKYLEKFYYYCGIFKRQILILIPQWFRWEIYKIIKN